MSKYTKLDSLFLHYLIRKRGAKCQICGRPEKGRFKLSRFHILPTSKYPKLRYDEGNVLLACWSPYYYMPYCHNLWHHNREQIEPSVWRLLGDGYIERLKILDKSAPKLDLKMIRAWLENEVNCE